MRSFKKPLKMEEERYYLKMYRNGDEKAKEKLIEHNLRLVAHIVKKYNKYMFENTKLNINSFLSCTECKHSCAIVCILVYVF